MRGLPASAELALMQPCSVISSHCGLHPYMGSHLKFNSCVLSHGATSCCRSQITPKMEEQPGPNKKFNVMDVGVGVGGSRKEVFA